MSTPHKFTATLQLIASAPRVETRAAKRWSSRNQENQQIEVEFYAADPPAAMMRLHFVVQRLLRGVAQPNTKRRYRYRPSDYKVLSMRSANGDYDLPRQANPDFSSVEARREYLDNESERIKPRDFRFVPYPLPLVSTED